jgi:hypothetical protein
MAAPLHKLKKVTLQLWQQYAQMSFKNTILSLNRTLPSIQWNLMNGKLRTMCPVNLMACKNINDKLIYIYTTNVYMYMISLIELNILECESYYK